MTNEIWKDIEDYEGLYQVSNFGRVRNSFYKIIKTFLSDSGRLRCTLYDYNHKSKHWFIHILAAKTFVYNDDPESKTEVHHIDFNKTNNDISNLIWLTHDEHKALHRKINGMPVDCFDLNGNFVKHYDSIHSVEKDGHASTRVMNICKHKPGCYTHHKLRWELSK